MKLISKEEFVKRCDYRTPWFLADDYDSILKAGLVILDKSEFEKINKNGKKK